MKKICLNCKTENEQGFQFCKRCGAALPVVEQKANLDAEFVSEGRDNANFEETSIDGVSQEHLRSYIGKNHNRILDSFYNMSIYNKKTSFCFPVLILGLLFGFVGMSIWFFYRKMNKIGFLLLSVPIIFSLIDIAINLPNFATFLEDYSRLFSSFIADADAFGTQLDLVTDRFTQSFTSFIPEIRNLIEYLVAPVFMSVFALHFYKNKALKSVKEILASCPNDSNLSLRLFLSGGTSATRCLIPFGVIFGFTFILMFAMIGFII